MCIKPIVKRLHNFSFLQPIVNIFPVLRIAGLGNFYDTRRCNKAYPVSFGDRLSFSQESGLNVQICCIEVCRQISAFSRERHLPCQYRESVSKVRLHQSLSLPRLLFKPKCHDGTSSSCCLTNSLQSCKICWKKRTVPLTAPQPSIASYCLYFSGLDYSSSGPCRIWGITSTHSPLFSSFLHGRPVFPVPGRHRLRAKPVAALFESDLYLLTALHSRFSKKCGRPALRWPSTFLYSVFSP